MEKACLLLVGVRLIGQVHYLGTSEMFGIDVKEWQGSFQVMPIGPVSQPVN